MVRDVDTDEQLTKEHKERISLAAEIVDSFAWHTTEEGCDYWCDVYAKLFRIANQEEKVCEHCGTRLLK